MLVIGGTLYGLDALGLIDLDEMAKSTNSKNTEKTTEKVKKEELIPIIDEDGIDANLGIDLSNKQVGDCVAFGSYEQDNDFDNGKEPIDWVILKIENEYALLMSKYALDWEEIFYEYEPSVIRPDYHWSNSKIRETLNDTFYKEAFSDEEKNFILNTNVKTYGTRLSANPTEYEIDYSLRITKDKIFLLSYTDVTNSLYGFGNSLEKKYNYTRVCEATEYAARNAARHTTIIVTSYVDGVDYCLRSQGNDIEFGGRVRDKVNTTKYLSTLQYVDGKGQLNPSGRGSNTYFIRPACIVKIVQK